MSLVLVCSTLGSRGEKRDVLGSALGGKKRLGPAYAHRARRSTVVLDAVVKRVTENETIAEVNNAEKAMAEEEEIERETRIRFAESTVLDFLMDVEVSRLLTWGPMGKRAVTVSKPAPSPLKKPLKSILRVRLEPVQQVYPEPDDLVAPPTVQTVSISGHSSRQLDLSSSQSSFIGVVTKQSKTQSESDGSSWSGGRKSPPPPLPEDETSPPALQFAKRTEQTNRSPPPDFDVRLSLDEGSVLSSSPVEIQEIEDDDNDFADEQPQPISMPPALLMENDINLGGSLSLAANMEQDAAVVVESVSVSSE